MSEGFNHAVVVLRANDRFDALHDDASFVGRLHEEGIFDPSACQALDDAIAEALTHDPSVETVGRIVRILAHLLRLTRAHLDPMDVFKVRGLSRTEVDDLDARVHHQLLEVSYGRVPRLEDWPIPGGAHEGD